MTDTSTVNTQTKTLTDWTYYLASFAGVLRTVGAAIEEDKWGFDSSDKNLLSLLEALYKSVQDLDKNFISLINSGDKVVINLTPAPIDQPFPSVGNNPGVIAEAWSAFKAALTPAMQELKDLPVLYESAETLLNSGEALAKASATLISDGVK
ncbi:hypothetical protein GV054_04465 [Marinomonas mediterranea]|uniref:hypothetical protein n=1 Tax=Marinomonas mediterranea TaxID=119864 RepID=UPI00234BF716|nr:hypothetical protein [Marinomonas mediterranea]WCN12306.1 hypothetical protein GV054_04465 [Marinomonas mediterranea]